MFNQFLFLLYITVLGTLLLFFLKDHLRITNFYLLSLPAGLGAWLFFLTFLFLLPIPLNRILILTLSLILLASLFIIQKKKLFFSKYWKSMGIFWGFASLFSLFFLKFNFSVISNDSWRMIIGGKALVSSQRLIENLISSAGIYSYILHSTSTLFGFDYLYALFPLLTLSFGLFFLYNLTLNLNLYSSLPKTQPLFSSSLTLFLTLLLFSSFIILYHSIYIHNNLLFGIFTFIALFGLWKRASQGKRAWLLISWGALLTSCLFRIEGPLFALIVVILLISIRSIPYKEKFYYVGLLSLFMILWHAYLALILSGFTSDYFLTSQRVLLITALYIGALILLILYQKTLFKRIKKFFPLAMVYSLTFGWSFFIFTKGLRVKGDILILEKYGTLTLNVLENGGWGIIWIVLGVLFFIGLLLKRFHHESIFIYYILSFFLFFNILNLYRGGWREGWGDSGNRMLIHIVFIVAFYTFFKWGRLFLSKIQK